MLLGLSFSIFHLSFFIGINEVADDSRCWLNKSKARAVGFICCCKGVVGVEIEFRFRAPSPPPPSGEQRDVRQPELRQEFQVYSSEK
jgi:hypothetical protein